MLSSASALLARDVFGGHVDMVVNVMRCNLDVLYTYRWIYQFFNAHAHYSAQLTRTRTLAGPAMGAIDLTSLQSMACRQPSRASASVGGAGGGGVSVRIISKCFAGPV